jgi:hypothetical protein
VLRAVIGRLKHYVLRAIYKADNSNLNLTKRVLRVNLISVSTEITEAYESYTSNAEIYPPLGGNGN